MILFLTCEHAGNELPDQYQEYFQEAEVILETHRGYDPGALNLFNRLSRLSHFSQPYMISRLLVEPNRSIGHPQLFSEFTEQLSDPEKEEILHELYFPYRNYIEGRIENYRAEGHIVLHLSVHTFTPILDGEVRTADIGLLFDPARREEADFCKSFQKSLFKKDKDLHVRFNYPYLGVDDGFTTYLRDKFPEHYLGIELEVNQKFVEKNIMEKRLKNVIFEALNDIL
ncbi:N-formylglutamate amidohydrolase [Salinimicrobium oceani]|uniref:N-formylglutamate amidohydrolase n=1 Tax=Salinimicrobium oceani TaxID=2722702 RepID=A0ABX1D3X6_9FLAO|nr:N-formylglutamate amidohydrolase [Salinimicrobium oceani]NJW53231.1 N-formylglutamate amidohydrolase [Salinimicrobium oceani]